MKRNKGLTLIELIISLAMVGIIAVVFLSVFNTGLVNIVRAGTRTVAVGKAAEEFQDEPTVMSNTTIDIELPIPGGATQVISINGSYAKGSVYVTEGTINLQVEIETFIPNYIGVE